MWYEHFCQGSVEEKGKPICLISNQSANVMKMSNVSRHYDTIHKDEFQELRDEARKQRLDKRIKGLKRQQDSLFKPIIDKEKAMLSSYIVSQKIVEKCMVVCAIEL